MEVPRPEKEMLCCFVINKRAYILWRRMCSLRDIDDMSAGPHYRVLVRYGITNTNTEKEI